MGQNFFSFKPPLSLTENNHLSNTIFFLRRVFQANFFDFSSLLLTSEYPKAPRSKQYKLRKISVAGSCLNVTDYHMTYFTNSKYVCIVEVEFQERFSEMTVQFSCFWALTTFIDDFLQ